MGKHYVLADIISARIEQGLSVDFTPQNKFSDPSITLTEMDGEGIRKFLIERKLVSKYYEWQLKQDMHYMVRSNDMDISININIEFLEQTNKFFLRFLKDEYPRFKKLIHQNIGHSDTVIDMSIRLNQIVDIFQKLFDHDFITFYDYPTLAKWLAKHFRYRIKDGYRPVHENLALDILNDPSRKTKNPIIEIHNKQIIWASPKPFEEKV